MAKRKNWRFDLNVSKVSLKGWGTIWSSDDLPGLNAGLYENSSQMKVCPFCARLRQGVETRELTKVCMNFAILYGSYTSHKWWKTRAIPDDSGIRGSCVCWELPTWQDRGSLKNIRNSKYKLELVILDILVFSDIPLPRTSVFIMKL